MPEVRSFDAGSTGLSPKDVPGVSKRMRVTIFLTAWLTTIWFIVAPWIPQLHVWAGLTMIPYQLYWTYLMIWVCRWALEGSSMVRKKFKSTMIALRREKNGHRKAPEGYTLPELIHWVILPNYKEDLDVMRGSLNALAAQSIGAHRICIIMACEKAEAESRNKAMSLAREFPEFRKFVCNVHVLREGECAGKSANVSASFRSLCAAAYAASKDARLADVQERLRADFETWYEADDARVRDFEPFAALLDRGIVTVMDADSVFHPHYFFAVEQSFHFEHHATRNETIWQAPIANYMNVHRIPNLSRAMCLAVSLHELASLSHPTKLKLPFSTYSMTAALVLKTGGWASDVIAEDWHMFERVFFATSGRAKVRPIHLPVVCYAVEADGWWGSVKARYTQAVRHAWASIETASFFALWRDMPRDQRPGAFATLLVFWKIFKLHFVGVFQFPLSISSAVAQFLFMYDGYSILHPPSTAEGFFSPAGNNFAAWIVFLVLSVLVSLLPVAAVFSAIAHWKYENALQEIYHGAYEWADMRLVERRLRGTVDGAGADAPRRAPVPGVDTPAEAKPKKRVKKAKSVEKERLLDVDDDNNDADADGMIDVLDDDDDVVASQPRESPRVLETQFDTFGEDRSPPMQSTDLQKYEDQYLIPMAPTAWTRVKQIPEAVLIVPVAAFMFGFLPEFYCQTVQVFKKYLVYKVAAKPTSGGSTV